MGWWFVLGGVLGKRSLIIHLGPWRMLYPGYPSAAFSSVVVHVACQGFPRAIDVCKTVVQRCEDRNQQLLRNSRAKHAF